MAEDVRATIARVAREEGLDPSYALAVAERESSFNPQAGGTGTIRGLYQFTGANRKKYGLDADASVEDQTRAFARFTNDLRGDMAKRLGREPTPGELYAGHAMGGGRAARIISGQTADQPPRQVFSDLEMRGNPHFARAGTAGDLTASIGADIDRRMAKHGGAAPAPAPGRPAIDFASYGEPAPAAKPIQVAQAETGVASDASPLPALPAPVQAAPPSPVLTRPSAKTVSPAPPIDFASFGEPAGPVAAGNQSVPPTSFAPSNEGGISVVPKSTPAPAVEKIDMASMEKSGKNLRPGSEVDISAYADPANPGQTLVGQAPPVQLPQPDPLPIPQMPDRHAPGGW